MSSVWFGLLLFLYIICVKIIAIPLRIAKEDTTSTGVDAKLRLKRERDQLTERIPKSRTRREIAGCDAGSVYGFAQVPHCHVTDAVYNIKMELCLVKLIDVLGMPDGDKGYNYLAHDEILYKSYNATNRFDIVRCPEIATPTKVTTQTISSASRVKLSTKTISSQENGGSKTAASTSITTAITTTPLATKQKLPTTPQSSSKTSTASAKTTTSATAMPTTSLTTTVK